MALDILRIREKRCVCGEMVVRGRYCTNCGEYAYDYPSKITGKYKGDGV